MFFYVPDGLVQVITDRSLGLVEWRKPTNQHSVRPLSPGALLVHTGFGWCSLGWADETVEAFAFRAKCIYSAGNFGIFDQGRGVTWFDAGVDDQGRLAAPMFVGRFGFGAVAVPGGVGTGKGDPDEIGNRGGGEGTVIG